MMVLSILLCTGAEPWSWPVLRASDPSWELFAESIPKYGLFECVDRDERTSILRGKKTTAHSTSLKRQ